MVVVVWSSLSFSLVAKLLYVVVVVVVGVVGVVGAARHPRLGKDSTKSPATTTCASSIVAPPARRYTNAKTPAGPPKTIKQTK